MQLIATYYTARAYFYFRKTGGIKGHNRTQDLPEEELIKKAGAASKKVGETIEKAIDKDNEREKKEDLEAQKAMEKIEAAKE